MDREKVIRLIDTLIFEAQNEQTWKVEALKCLKKELLKKQDAVVQCKYCKYSKEWYGDKRRCFLWVEHGIDVFEDDYCSYGRPKEGR